MKDIFIDSNILVDLGTDRATPELVQLVDCIINSDCDVHLVITQKILNEYIDTCHFFFRFWQIIIDNQKLNQINPKDLKKRQHVRNYNSCIFCNKEDIWHTEAICLSHRKKCITKDNALQRTINCIPKINHVKPIAMSSPDSTCF